MGEDKALFLNLFAAVWKACFLPLFDFSSGVEIGLRLEATGWQMKDKTTGQRAVQGACKVGDTACVRASQSCSSIPAPPALTSPLGLRQQCRAQVHATEPVCIQCDHTYSLKFFLIDYNKRHVALDPLRILPFASNTLIPAFYRCPKPFRTSSVMNL